MTFGINSRIDYSLCAAGAYGFYLRYRIGYLKKPPASGEKMRHEVCAQSEAEHGNIAEIDYLAQLVYLLGREKLAFVRDYDIYPAHFIEQGDDALLMRDDIRLCRETYARGDNPRAVARVGRRLYQPDAHSALFVIEFCYQRVCGFR